MPSGVIAALSVSSLVLNADTATLGSNKRTIRDHVGGATATVNSSFIQSETPMDIQVGVRGAGTSLYVAGPAKAGNNVTFNGGELEEGLALKVERGDAVFDVIKTRKLIVTEPDKESADAKVTKADLDQIVHKLVSVTGTQMSGPLLLPAVSSSHPNSAVSRNFVETAIKDSETRAKTSFLPIAGGQITAKLKQPATLPTDPNDTVCTKGYVLSLMDGKGGSVDTSNLVPLTGATMSGKLFVPSPSDTDPENTVATKGYLESRLSTERENAESVFLSKTQSALITGKLRTAQTNANDADDTLATKLYVESTVNGIRQEISAAASAGTGGGVQDLTALDARYAKLDGCVFPSKPKSTQQTVMADSDDTLVTKLFTENLVAVAMDNAIKETTALMRTTSVLVEGGEMTGPLYLPNTADQSLADNQAVSKADVSKIVKTSLDAFVSTYAVANFFDASKDLASALQRAVNAASEAAGPDDVFTILLPRGKSALKSTVVIPAGTVLQIKGEDSRDGLLSEAWKTVLDVQTDCAFVVNAPNAVFENIGFVSGPSTSCFIKATGGVDLFNCHFLATGPTTSAKLIGVQLYTSTSSPSNNRLRDCTFSNQSGSPDSPLLNYLVANAPLNLGAELSLDNVIFDGGRALHSKAIDVSGLDVCSIHNSTFKLLESGISAVDIRRLRLQNCQTETVVNFGSAKTVGSVYVDGCYFSGSVGVFDLDSNGTVLFTDNELETCGSDQERVLSLKDNKRVQIKGCVFKECISAVSPVLISSVADDMIIFSENIFDRIDGNTADDTYVLPVELRGKFGAVILSNNVFDLINPGPITSIDGVTWKGATLSGNVFTK